MTLPKKKELFFIVLLLVSFLFFHVNALINYLYWKIKWLDMPMHFFGSFLIVCLFSWFYVYSANKQKHVINKISFFGLCIFFSICAGFMWETFEVQTHFVNQAFNGYSLDTAKDIVFDLLGGVMGFYLFSKRYRRNFSDLTL